jgi:hypothetical protein
VPLLLFRVLGLREKVATHPAQGIVVVELRCGYWEIPRSMAAADQTETFDAARGVAGREAGRWSGFARNDVLQVVRHHLLRVFPFQVVLTLILVVVVFALTRRGMNDPDIWWHLRNAEYLLNHFQLPRFDMYSYTVGGHLWINHEWLSEVPFLLAWRLGGLVGVKSLSIAVIVATFLALLYLCYKISGNFKASIAACAVCTFFATVNFGPRTILFGYLYLVVLLIILERFRRLGRAPLWLIPVLFAVWVNTHGSWLLGLIVFSVTIAAGLVQGTWGCIRSERWAPRQFGKLALTWVASIAALFLNPIGPRLVFYPFDLAFRQKLNIAHVAEWVSVDFHNLRGKIVLGLIVFLLVGLLLRRRRWTPTEWLLLLFGLYSGLTYIRFLFLLGILAAPVIAQMLDFFPPYRRELETPITNAMVVCVLIVAMVHYWPTAQELQQSVDADYPAGVLPYLKANPPTAPMLNFYLWGGYLGWNNNDLKVFVDSRVDIFEYEGVLKDYLALLEVHQANTILDKYKIRYVLFPKSEVLTYVLQHDPNWTVRYSDQLCVLLEKNGEHNAVNGGSGGS